MNDRVGVEHSVLAAEWEDTPVPNASTTLSLLSAGTTTGLGNQEGSQPLKNVTCTTCQEMEI